MEKNRTAIVVGGSSGIGYETCARLVSRGWNVTNISRTPCKNPKEKHGRDVLVYSAGFSMAAPIEYAKESDYRYLFDVNFFGALKAMQAAIPFMKNSGGRIILVGSLGGELPIIFDSFYSSSKAALEMLVREASTKLIVMRTA